MLKLHGFAYSNYHSVVKAVLLEKAVDFEEVVSFPPADSSYLAKNPTGKFPCMELDDGSFVGETKVLMNYLEDAHPEPRLLPADPVERARVRELMEVIDLYLELPARRLYREVFSNEGKVSAQEKEVVRPLLAQGVAGLRALARFAPYIAGDTITLADFSAAFHFVPVSIASRRMYGEDVLSALPGLDAYMELVEAHPSIRAAKEAQTSGEAAFMARPSNRPVVFETAADQSRARAQPQ